jgi:hypothetical protein
MLTEENVRAAEMNAHFNQVTAAIDRAEWHCVEAHTGLNEVAKLLQAEQPDLKLSRIAYNSFQQLQCMPVPNYYPEESRRHSAELRRLILVEATALAVSELRHYQAERDYLVSLWVVRAYAWIISWWGGTLLPRKKAA